MGQFQMFDKFLYMEIRFYSLIAILIFKGSVFVTFETHEDAEKFLETKGIKYNGTDLLKEWR